MISCLCQKRKQGRKEGKKEGRKEGGREGRRRRRPHSQDCTRPEITKRMRMSIARQTFDKGHNNRDLNLQRYLSPGLREKYKVYKLQQRYIPKKKKRCPPPPPPPSSTIYHHFNQTPSLVIRPLPSNSARFCDRDHERGKHAVFRAYILTETAPSLLLAIFLEPVFFIYRRPQAFLSSVYIIVSNVP